MKKDKFWSQLQLVNCVREDESLEGERKILRLIMIIYIVFSLFMSSKIIYVYFLKALKIWRSHGICDYMHDFPSKQRYLLPRT